MNSKVKVWLLGLVSAVLSGAAAGAGSIAISPDNLKQAGVLAGVGAIVGLVNYLTKSPLQDKGKE